MYISYIESECPTGVLMQEDNKTGRQSNKGCEQEVIGMEESHSVGILCVERNLRNSLREWSKEVLK